MIFVGLFLLKTKDTNVRDPGFLSAPSTAADEGLYCSALPKLQLFSASLLQGLYLICQLICLYSKECDPL